ncbi:zinc finger protein 583-like isoform X12 [Cydia splendana]|uniref:zinc finger protein 583-like isoform X12 n=1 Tax=Cydia splendana TaxID=1100963 RepID=UPI00300C4874
MMETPNTLHSGMCRCCSSEGTFKDIKTKYHWMGEEEVYAEMLTDCFDIKIQTPEDMDNGICEVCITQLRNAVNFKKQVLHTEEQFKRRLQGRDVKNPIKIESVEDPNDSDHLSDPDFTEEYEVPIKQEVEEKPKAKKRQAKPATPRAKKAKTEAESSQRVGWKLRRSMIAPREGKNTKSSKLKTIVISPKTEKPRKKRCKIIEIKPAPVNVSFKKLNEAHKHQANLKEILLCSNATPIRCRGSVGYACCFCSDQYRDPADLKQHTITSHDDTTKANYMKGESIVGFIVKLDITALRCNMCSSTIRELGHLMEHLKVAHDRPIITDLKNHLVPFRFESNLHSCVECSAEFSNFKVLLAHMNEHYRNCICEICGAGFVTKRILQAHSYRHITGDYSCRYCPKVFDAKLRMQEHERNVHVLMNKRNKCGYCGEKFTDYTKKNDHEVKVHGVKPVVLHCQACTKTFDNQRSLTVHTKTFHLMQRRSPKTSNPLKL